MKSLRFHFFNNNWEWKITQITVHAPNRDEEFSKMKLLFEAKSIGLRVRKKGKDIAIGVFLKKTIMTIRYKVEEIEIHVKIRFETLER